MQNQAIRAMSPQETSKWCSSLGLCGVRGVVLRELQEQILKQQIDGALFDKMLRTNSLIELGIDELNPRLALAIRRSWTTDFGASQFVGYEEEVHGHGRGGGGGGGAGPPAGGGPGHGGHGVPSPSGPAGGSIGPYGAPLGQARDAWQSGPQGSPAGSHDGFGGHGAHGGGGFPGDYPGGSASDFERSMGGRGAQAMNFDRTLGRNELQQDPYRGGRGGRGDPRDPYGGGGMGEDLYGAPPGNGKGAPPPQRDLFGARGSSAGGPRGPMPNGSPPPGRGGRDMLPPLSIGEWDQGNQWSQGDYGGPHDDMGGYDGSYGDPRMSPNAMGGPHGGGMPGHRQRGMPQEPPMRPMQSPTAPMQASRASPVGGGGPRGMPGGGWDGSPSPSPSSAYGHDPMQDPQRGYRQRGPPGGGGGGVGGSAWGDGGLDEVLAPRRRAPTTYDTEDPYGPSRTPARSSGMGGGAGYRGAPGMRGASAQAQMDWEGGLDAVLPARPPPPANIAQPLARQAQAARAREEAAYLAAQQDEEDEEENARYEAAHRHHQARGHEAGASDWGGTSLGDALQPKRRSVNAAEQMGGGRPPRGGMGRDMQDADFDDMPPNGRQGPGGGYPPNSYAGGYDDEPQAPYNQEEETYGVLVPPGRPPPGGASRPSALVELDNDVFAPRPPRRGGGDGAPAARSPQPPRSRAAATPAADGWGGQSLADAFAPKKKAEARPPASGGGGSSGSRAGGGGRAPVGGGANAGSSSKKPEEIVAWVRSLPESHVPEKSRENIAAIVEDGNLNGADFTSYIQQGVPPEICAPKHAMKLKAAWNNVLAEVAASEVARANAANKPTQKATMIVV